MKRTLLILSLVLLVGLLVLSACGGATRQGLTSHPSSVSTTNSSQAPALTSNDDLDQQLNQVEQSLNDMETSLNEMPALPDLR